MPLLSRVRFRIKTLFGREALERQLDEELQFHLEMQAAAHVRLGRTPALAYAIARREFGSVAEHKDDYRDRWGSRRLEAVVQDVQRGVRQAWQQRVTSAAIVMALALGIGVSTAVYSVFNGVLLQPPPFAESDRLVRLQVEAHNGERLFSAPEIRDLRSEAHTLQSLAEFHFMYFILLDGQEPLRVSAGVVSSNFFDVIGTRPALGRTFYPSEELAGAPGVIMLSHRFWMRELGGDPHIIGRVFTMNDRVHTVVGVLPALPSFPEEADIYLPTSACPLRMSDEGNLDRRSHLVSALGRVRADAPLSLASIKTDLTEAAARIGDRYPGIYTDRNRLELSAVAVNDDLVWRFRPTLAVLLASAAFLLLSLCSSVAALMLARALRRRRGVAMQVALGAWRGRLLQQFATESLLLTVLGGLLGLALARVSLPLLIELASRYTSRAHDIRLDDTAVLFAVALSMVLGLILGAVLTLVAAPVMSRHDVLAGKREAGRDPVFRALTIVQIAVSFALLVGAALAFKSVTNLQRIDTGFRTHDVASMRVSTDFIKYVTPAERADLYGALLREVRNLPEVADAAITGALPLVDPSDVSEVVVETPDAGGDHIARASVQSVSPEYFQTVGLDLLEGRTFYADATGATSKPALVNRTMAARVWPGGRAIGQRVSINGGEPRTIVGIVSDARQKLPETPTSEIFVPLDQYPPVQARLVVRSPAPPSALAARLRDAVRRAEPQQSIDSMLTFEDARDEAVAPIRVTATLITVFAVIAVTISLIGVAGVVGASVQARTRQLGLQMALGATRGRVIAAVLAEGLRLSAAGIALGLVLAILMSRSLMATLFEVSPYDATVHIAVGALLVAATLVACLMPARRAALVDPCVALRVG